MGRDQNNAQRLYSAAMHRHATKALNIWHSKLNSPRLQFAAKVIFIAGPLSLMLRNLHGNWQQMTALSVELSLERLLLATLILVHLFGLLPLSTKFVLRTLDYELDYYSSYRGYFLSQLAKYIPGGIWIVPGRVVAFKKYGISPLGSTVGTIVELAVLLAAASLVYFLFIFSEPSSNQFLLLGLIATSLTVGIISIRKKSSIIELLRPQGKWNITLNLNFRTTLKIFLIDITFWLLVGATFYILIGAVYSVPIQHIPAVVGAFSGAWAAGFVVFLVPSGLGVRDGVLALLLTNILPEPLPVVVAIMARVWWTAAEALSIAVASLINKWTDTGSTQGGSSES